MLIGHRAKRVAEGTLGQKSLLKTSKPPCFAQLFSTGYFKLNNGWQNQILLEISLLAVYNMPHVRSRKNTENYEKLPENSHFGSKCVLRRGHSNFSLNVFLSLYFGLKDLHRIRNEDKSNSTLP